MATTTTRLGVDIVARDRTSPAFASVQRQMREMGAAANMVKGVLGGMMAGLTVAGLTSTLRSTIDHMDELGKTAQKIGIPVEELSKLEYAARLADVSLGDLSGAVGRFSKSLAEVQGGGDNAAGAALKAMGIAAVDAQGQLRPTIDIMSDVAARFAPMQDGANKTATAMALFGKAGADLIPLLNGGREAIAGAAAEAAQFGVTVSGPAAQAAEQFNDNLTRLQAAAQGMTQQVAVGLLRVLPMLTETMVGYAREGTVANTVTREITLAFADAKSAIFEMSSYWNVLMQNMSDPQGFDVAVDRWRKASSEIAAERAKTLRSITGGDDPTGSLGALNAMADKLKGKGSLPPTMDPNTYRMITPPPVPPSLPSVKPGGTSGVPLISVITGYDIRGFGTEIDAAANSVNRLQSEFTSAATEAANMGTQISTTLAPVFEDWINQAIDGTFNLQDALTGLLKTLSSQFISSGLQGLFGGGAGVAPGGGLFGSLLGSLFGGFSGLYANGGSIPAGQWGIAGEAGPEIINGPATVVPFNAMGSGTRGDTGVVIHQHIAANGDKAIMEMARDAVKTGLREYDRQRPVAEAERNLRVR